MTSWYLFLSNFSIKISSFVAAGYRIGNLKFFFFFIQVETVTGADKWQISKKNQIFPSVINNFKIDVYSSGSLVELFQLKPGMILSLTIVTGVLT